MKTLKFDVDNFALTTNVLSVLQESYKLIQTLTNVIGPKFVISGCAENAGVIAPGIVCIDGEIMQTAGGSTSLLCKVESTVVNKTIQDGSYQYTENQLVFTSGGSFPWGYLKRLTSLSDLKTITENLSLETEDLDDRAVILENSVQVIENSLQKYTAIDITVASGSATIGAISYKRANRAGDVYALQFKFDVDYGTTSEAVVLQMSFGVPGAIVGSEIPVKIYGVDKLMTIVQAVPLQLGFADVYSQQGIELYINTIICG